MSKFIVNKNSWHYQMITRHDWLDEHIVENRHNVCSYVRKIAAGLLFIFLLSSFTAIISICMASSLTFIILGVTLDAAGWWEFPYLFGALLWTLGMIVGGSLLIKQGCDFLKIYKYNKRLRDGEEKKELEPSLAIEWIKSKHGKICVPIQFNDGVK